MGEALLDVVAPVARAQVEFGPLRRETRDAGALTPFVVQHFSRISLNNRAVKERRIHAAVKADGVIAGEATEIVL